jgi:hypothetical protein
MSGLALHRWLRFYAPRSGEINKCVIWESWRLAPRWEAVRRHPLTSRRLTSHQWLNQAYTCQQLALEAQAISTRAATLSGAQDSQRTKDGVVTAARLASGIISPSSTEGTGRYRPRSAPTRATTDSPTSTENLGRKPATPTALGPWRLFSLQVGENEEVLPSAEYPPEVLSFPVDRTATIKPPHQAV